MSRRACMRKGLVAFNSEKLEKAGTVDFKKHPARKVGTRSRQCGPKVPGRFSFPGARKPIICSISRFRNIFPAIFPGLSRSFSLGNPRTDSGNSHSLLEFSDQWSWSFLWEPLQDSLWQSSPPRMALKDSLLHDFFIISLFPSLFPQTGKHSRRNID